MSGTRNASHSVRIGSSKDLWAVLSNNGLGCATDSAATEAMTMRPSTTSPAAAGRAIAAARLPVLGNAAVFRAESRYARRSGVRMMPSAAALAQTALK
jgi:hypothetical protein